ncbi:MAG: DUF3426 domain-containing protein [Alphaproteobacteria bacterium]
MIITCPACATQFFVPDDKIGPKGRKVRCAQCAHSWRQEPVAPPRERAPKPEIDDDDPFATPAYEEGPPDEGLDEALDDDLGVPIDDIDDEDDVAEMAEKLGADGDDDIDDAEPARRRGGWLGWVALLLVLAGLGGAAVVLRQQVVDFWPPAARAYQMAKLDVVEPSMFGLSIQNVTSERAIDSGQRVLLVSGDVINDAVQPKPLPRLRVALTDAGGKEIYFWTVTLAKPELEPAETVRFSTRLPNPPAAAKSLAVRFDVH